MCSGRRGSSHAKGGRKNSRVTTIVAATEPRHLVCSAWNKEACNFDDNESVHVHFDKILPRVIF